MFKEMLKKTGMIDLWESEKIYIKLWESAEMRML